MEILYERVDVVYFSPEDELVWNGKEITRIDTSHINPENDLIQPELGARQSYFHYPNHPVLDDTSVSMKQK